MNPSIMTSDNGIVNFQNPFTQSGVTRITLCWSKVIFEPRFEWDADVWFTKGDTSGRQNFKNSELPTVLKEIDAFVKSLEK